MEVFAGNSQCDNLVSYMRYPILGLSACSLLVESFRVLGFVKWPLLERPAQIAHIVLIVYKNCILIVGSLTAGVWVAVQLFLFARDNDCLDSIGFRTKG